MMFVPLQNAHQNNNELEAHQILVIGFSVLELATICLCLKIVRFC